MAAADLPETIERVAANCRPLPAELAGAGWRMACEGEDLMGAMTRTAAAQINDLSRRTGLLPTKGFVAAVNRLVTEHIAVVVAYADLLDGTAYVHGGGFASEQIINALSADRMEHVAETEERHLRSGLVMLLSSLGGVEAQAAVTASGKLGDDWFDIDGERFEVGDDALTHDLIWRLADGTLQQGGSAGDGAEVALADLAHGRVTELLEGGMIRIGDWSEGWVDDPMPAEWFERSDWED